jgi:GT2 family glycosyltransferase
MKIVTIEGDSHQLVVVVPTPDVNRQLTKEFFESMKRTATFKPTIVAVESSGPEFHFSKSMNAGIKTALGFGPKYIALSNDDVRPLTPEWDAKLTNTLEAHADVAYVAPLLWQGQAISGPIVLMPSYLSILLFTSLYNMIPTVAFSLIRTLRGLYLNLRLRGKSRGVELGTGALVNSQPFSIFKANVLKELSGFDEEFVNGCEDFDLSLRVLERGWKIALEVDVSFEDKGSATVGKGGFSILYGRVTKASKQSVNNWKLLIKKRGACRYQSTLKQCAKSTLIIGDFNRRLNASPPQTLMH